MLLRPGKSPKEMVIINFSTAQVACKDSVRCTASRDKEHPDKTWDQRIHKASYDVTGIASSSGGGKNAGKTS